MLLLKNLVAALFVVCLLPLISVGQVVENDAVLISTPGGYFGEFELGLTQTTSFGGDALGLFGFGVEDLGGNQFQFNAFGIAEAYALFSIDPGQVVSPEFVNNTVPFASNFNDLFTPQPDGVLSLGVGESVFFGYWDERDVFGPDGGFFTTADAGDNFGWLELGRSDRADGSFGQLEILGGATAIGQGIIVGTTTAVAIPEPSASVLAGLLSAYAVARRRRR